VLEPLGGYLRVGQQLLEGKPEFATGWNFGPADDADLSVREVVENIKRHWDRIETRVAQIADAPHEAHLLKLDCTKAREQLNWHPVWSSQTTFEKTVGWYHRFYEDGEILTHDDLCEYEREMKK